MPGASEPTKPSTVKGDGPPKRPSWGFALGVLAVITGVGVVVFLETRAPIDSYRNHDPFVNTDDRELRQVVQAISVIIRTPDSSSEPPVAALEALHPDSPGAADLRDACATTYRGLVDLNHLQGALHALDPHDGAAAPSNADIASATVTLQRALQIEHAVRDTKDRCLALYQAACDRLGIHPALRGNAHTVTVDGG